MQTHNTLFITATDTGVGKTLISGLLLSFMIGNGIDAGYQKWVATGCDGDDLPEDLTSCLDIAGQEQSPDLLDLQVPYRLAYPAAPQLAAEREGVKIDPAIIEAAYREMAERYEILIVEGVGGLLVPLNRELLLADMLARLKPPTVIVARSGLGTINHTLMTIEAMRQRQIPLAGVIFTDSAEEDETIANDNMNIISLSSGVNILGRLPYLTDFPDLNLAFKPTGERIIESLNQHF